jgi:hypothetical protein
LHPQKNRWSKGQNTPPHEADEQECKNGIAYLLTEPDSWISVVWERVLPAHDGTLTWRRPAYRACAGKVQKRLALNARGRAQAYIVSLRPCADYTRYRVHALAKAWHHIPCGHGIFAGPQAQFAFAG